MSAVSGQCDACGRACWEFHLAVGGEVCLQCARAPEPAPCSRCGRDDLPGYLVGPETRACRGCLTPDEEVAVGVVSLIPPEPA